MRPIMRISKEYSNTLNDHLTLKNILKFIQATYKKKPNAKLNLKIVLQI